MLKQSPKHERKQAEKIALHCTLLQFVHTSLHLLVFLIYVLHEEGALKVSHWPPVLKEGDWINAHSLQILCVMLDWLTAPDE